MITINNTDFSSSIDLAGILVLLTKAEMLDICKRLDLYVSPNLKKEETARRLALELLDSPIEILSSLCKQELQIVDEFVKGGPNTYVIRKSRKTLYKLQKYCLVLTYEDTRAQQWHMIMPDSVRESLSQSLPFYLDLAERGVKPPTAKQLRMIAALNRLMNHKE